jgi:hypothetical protein
MKSAGLIGERSRGHFAIVHLERTAANMKEDTP